MHGLRDTHKHTESTSTEQERTDAQVHLEEFFAVVVVVVVHSVGIL